MAKNNKGAEKNKGAKNNNVGLVQNNEIAVADWNCFEHHTDDSFLLTNVDPMLCFGEEVVEM